MLIFILVLFIFSAHCDNFYCTLPVASPTEGRPVTLPTSLYHANWLVICIDNLDGCADELLPKRIPRYGAQRHGHYADVIIKWYTLYVL